jgi:hypothetical protein
VLVLGHKVGAIPADAHPVSPPVPAERPDVSTPPPGERRGQPLTYSSYWSHQRRLVRRDVFLLREQGYSVAAIASELGLDRGEVEAILLSDRRSRRPS